MLKTGIIGLGDIATKAYLPVIAGFAGLELHICSRSTEKLAQVAGAYRLSNLHDSIESLIRSGIRCAFVHSATDAHYETVKALLVNGIHVYVDKPVTMHLEQTRELVELAAARRLILMTGFNRRYAPSYRKLKEMSDPTMIIMQKNRSGLPDYPRRFVVEDFIHVVDTLRYLFPYRIDEVTVKGMRKGNLLQHLVLQLVSHRGPVAIGIMNRNSGTTEEKVEVMAEKEKRVVYNVAELVIEKERNTTRIGGSDWESTLHKRGFVQMVSDFLAAVKDGTQPQISADDALLTHEICEKIVNMLEGEQTEAPGV